MHVPRLPNPDFDLHPGDLVFYRWWCATRCSWVTDGVPHVIVATSDDGMATVLMAQGPIAVPMSLLQSVDEGCTFFASII